jgi:hypothetical protein
LEELPFRAFMKSEMEIFGFKSNARCRCSGIPPMANKVDDKFCMIPFIYEYNCCSWTISMAGKLYFVRNMM